MKLIHPIFSHPICIKEDKINVIQIENKNVFRKFVQEFYLQVNQVEQGNFLITENKKEISLSKNVFLITDIFAINLNQKKVLTKLYEHLGKMALSSDYYMKTQEVLNNVQEFLISIADEEDVPLSYVDKIDVIDLFKISKMKIDHTHMELLETIIDYINVVCEYMEPKCMVFVNLKLFFGQAELELIYHHAIYKKVYLLLIESIETEKKSEIEQILILDQDFCEIY